MSSRFFNFTALELEESTIPELTGYYHDALLLAMVNASKGNFDDAEYYFRKASAFRQIVQRRLKSNCAKHQFAIDALRAEIDNIRDYLECPESNFRFKSNLLTRIAITNGVDIKPNMRPRGYAQYLARLTAQS